MSGSRGHSRPRWAAVPQSTQVWRLQPACWQTAMRPPLPRGPEVIWWVGGMNVAQVMRWQYCWFHTCQLFYSFLIPSAVLNTHHPLPSSNIHLRRPSPIHTHHSRIAKPFDDSLPYLTLLPSTAPRRPRPITSLQRSADLRPQTAPTPGVSARQRDPPPRHADAHQTGRFFRCTSGRRVGGRVFCRCQGAIFIRLVEGCGVSGGGPRARRRAGSLDCRSPSRHLSMTRRAPTHWKLSVMCGRPSRCLIFSVASVLAPRPPFVTALLVGRPVATAIITTVEHPTKRPGPRET